eukprot:SAG31_NODE_29044_length_401_cov_1.367550_1_plen_106_part_01
MQTTMPVIDWQVGNTKVFMKASMIEVLENQRQALLILRSRIVQAHFRSFPIRNFFRSKKRYTIMLQSFHRRNISAKRYRATKESIVEFQATVKGRLARLLVSREQH